MSYSLPSHPSVRYLSEQAKDLLKAHRHGEVAVCQILRRLHRFQDQTDAQILSVRAALHEAQYALALEYGFKSWEDLIHHAQAAREAVVFKDPRATRLHFTGDAFRQDTFSLAVTTALSVLGRPADYETVYILSSNPFAPDLRPEEPSRCHWQMQGRERCLDLIAAAFGLAHRPFPDYHDLADIPPMPRDNEAAAVWLKEYYAKPAASYLSHALQMGEVAPRLAIYDH